MYQAKAKNGKPPSPELAAAMAKFEQAKLEQIAAGIANSGGPQIQPANLAHEQQRAVMAMLKQARNVI